MQKVFVCDDDSISLTMTGMILQKHYDIKICNNPLEALAIIHEFKPDIIILDIMMPNLNGIDLARKIISTEGRGIPIIFLSACEYTDTIKDAFVAGGFDYVIKPIVRKTILKKIEYCLATRGSISTPLDIGINHMDVLANLLLR